MQDCLDYDYDSSFVAESDIQDGKKLVLLEYVGPRNQRKLTLLRFNEHGEASWIKGFNDLHQKMER